MNIGKVLKIIRANESVDQAFIDKIEDSGISVNYGNLGKWDNQPNITIGNTTIWLVEEFLNKNKLPDVRFKRRNDVITEVFDALQNECNDDLDRNNIDN